MTEAVFSWPGLGTLVIQSINLRDWPVLQGSLIAIGTSFVLVNIAVDVVYAYLDPRVAYD
ncbi:MAG: ABC transporter permease subunit [Halobacteriales archaeon]|nr:ABC transporter permease subunit [Halobacteriales archaeon]